MRSAIEMVLKRWAMMKGQENADQSLTTSELQLMIEDAVAKATSDFDARLEFLERARLTGDRDESKNLLIPEEVVKTVGKRAESTK